MKLYVLALLGTIACEPWQQHPRWGGVPVTPPKEAPKAPLRAPTIVPETPIGPETPTFTDEQLAQCVEDWAKQEYIYLSTGRNQRRYWLKELEPLMDQFKFTPWAEIPESVQEAIKEFQAEVMRKKLAEEAIRLNNPVSKTILLCKPGNPHCFDVTHPDNQGWVGGYYAILLNWAVKAFEEASNVSDGTLILQTLQSGNKSKPLEYSQQLQKALVEEFQKAQVVHDKFDHFLSLLPESAILPPRQWPEAKPMPSSCEGIIEIPSRAPKPKVNPRTKDPHPSA